MLKKILSYSLPVVGLGSFLFVQAFAVGFLLNVFVPKTIDSGPQGPVARALLIDGLLLALFGLQHSIMARRKFKRWLTRFIPERFERGFYVIISSAVMAAMMFHWQPLKHPVWSATQGYTTALFYVLFGAKMPSVLVETSFISNPLEEKLLSKDDYRGDLAKSISSGITKYMSKTLEGQTVAGFRKDLAP